MKRRNEVNGLEELGVRGRVEWDEDSDAVQIENQVKQVVVDSTREVSGYVRVGRKNPNSVWCKDEDEAAAERKELYRRMNCE